MRGGLWDALDLKDIGKNKDATEEENTCRAVCKTCARGFSYPKRRGRPPGTCPSCAGEFAEKQAARQAKKEKKKIQREERSMDLAYDYIKPDQYRAELEKSRRERYQAFVERVADIHTMPTYEEYYGLTPAPNPNGYTDG